MKLQKSPVRFPFVSRFPLLQPPTVGHGFSLNHTIIFTLTIQDLILQFHALNLLLLS